MGTHRDRPTPADRRVGVLRLGRVDGIEIAAHWTLPVVAIAMISGLCAIVLPSAVAGRPATDYAGAAAQIVVLALAGLLAHVLAHVLTARHHGRAVRRVTVWPLGGRSESAGDVPGSAALAVAVAGPAVNLVLSGVAEVAAAAAKTLGLPALTVVSLTWFSGVNILLALVNMLPAVRAARALLCRPSATAGGR